MFGFGLAGWIHGDTLLGSGGGNLEQIIGSVCLICTSLCRTRGPPAWISILVRSVVARGYTPAGPGFDSSYRDIHLIKPYINYYC